MTQKQRDSTSDRVQLRQVTPNDVAWMAEMAADRELVGAHNWSGAAPDPAEVEQELLDRLAVDGCVSPLSGQLIVEVPDGPAVGDVSWRSERWGPSPKSRCVAIGIALLPQFRGLGYGTAAQRLLVGYLLSSIRSFTEFSPTPPSTTWPNVAR